MSLYRQCGLTKRVPMSAPPPKFVILFNTPFRSIRKVWTWIVDRIRWLKWFSWN